MHPVSRLLLPTSQAFIFSAGLGILSLGSLRLEIRRISGHIHINQVYWEEGDDGKGVCVFNPDGIKVIDNAKQGNPPWIIFEFKFREDPKITQMIQRIREENMDTIIGVQNHLETTPKLPKSGTLAALADSEGTSFHVSPHYGLSLIKILFKRYIHTY